jgi:chromosome segregation ATPase
MSTTAPTETASVDIQSIMKQVAALQQQNSSLSQEKEGLSEQVKSFTSQVKQNEESLTKLRGSKQREMQQTFQGIKSWLDGVPMQDAAVRDQLTNGLQDYIAKAADESGVWQVMVCASSAAAKKDEEFQQLRAEYESLKTRHEVPIIKLCVLWLLIQNCVCFGYWFSVCFGYLFMPGELT